MARLRAGRDRRARARAAYELPGFDAADRVRRAAGQRAVVERGARGRAAAGPARARSGSQLDDVSSRGWRSAAETEFVGAPVGIMDQMASSLGRRPGDALFLDTRTLAYERVPLPPSVALMVIDSGMRTRHAGGEYAARRRECERGGGAARRRAAARPRSLRRVAHRPRLPPARPAGASRRHGERARASAVARAARRRMPPALGALFDASHASMRDDYEISTPEIDVLVADRQQAPASSARGSPAAASAGCVVVAQMPRPGRWRRMRYAPPTGETGRRPAPRARSCRVRDLTRISSTARFLDMGRHASGVHRPFETDLSVSLTSGGTSFFSDRSTS